jgi:hypothetical protein
MKSNGLKMFLQKRFGARELRNDVGDIFKGEPG